MVGTVRDHFSEPGDPLRVGGILSDELPCDIFCQYTGELRIILGRFRLCMEGCPVITSWTGRPGISRFRNPVSLAWLDLVSRMPCIKMNVHRRLLFILSYSYNYYRPVTGKYKKKERDGIIQWYGRQGSGIFAEK